MGRCVWNFKFCFNPQIIFLYKSDKREQCVCLFFFFFFFFQCLHVATAGLGHAVLSCPSICALLKAKSQERLEGISSYLAQTLFVLRWTDWDLVA